jgi:RND family efflux transporter MFP subunit
MSIWKQLALTLAILIGAAALWVKFFPGAGDQLARWGIDWLPFDTASTETPAGAGAPGGRGNRSGGGGFAQGEVITAAVIEQTINDRLSAIGTGRANRSVAVTPFDSGRMVELLVESGSTVSQGDLIARLDSETEQIAFERAEIALKDAEARLERVQALRSSNTVTQVQVTEATLNVDNARLELRNAELALNRRSVEAPIGGVIGILPITAGNYVTSQTVIATIDDRSEILVDFWVPERYASMISVGSALTATSIARPGDVFRGNVNAVDNRVDAASRTLQVQARLANDGDRLRAGMSFQVTMAFPGDQFPAVDPLAIQWGTDGAFVWAIRNGRAERVGVRIVQRNTDSVLLDAPLGPQDVVVTEGLHIVRDGAEVRVAARGRALPPQEPAAETAPVASGS